MNGGVIGCLGVTMSQMGFFDLSDRYASLDAKKDPLVEIDAVVPWEEFRPTLERVWRKPDAERKSRAGRKPMDAVLMFKTLVLGALYNLSDDQIEYQVRDRLSFMRFLGLGLEDRVPDAKTVWLYREALAQAGLVEALFKQFDGYLARRGYIARGGQILDASIVPVPKNHNTREENKAIKSGEVPEGWSDKPAKRSQKDVDARWTKKHGKLSTAVQYPATRRSKIRPRGGDRRHGARACQIAGACHGALAPWAKTAPSDFRTFVAAFGQCCWRDDNSRRSSRGC